MTTKNKKRVLILCTGNSCRSQMAEGVLRRYGGDLFDVHSAGTKPSSVNPVAVEVMKEVGIDISGQRSKHVGEFENQKFDLVITVCDDAREACPFFPGAKHALHWPFPDPPHSRLVNEDVKDEFRRVRDLIFMKFRHYAEEEHAARTRKA